MINPFFIKNQQVKLEKYAEQIGKRKAICNPDPVFGTKISIENANHAYAYYLLNTRTLFGKLASIIPGTTAFSSRIRAARAIDVAYNKLSKTEKNIKAIDKLPVKAPLKRSASAGDIEQPKHYGSPLKPPKSATKDASAPKRAFQPTIFRVN